MTLTALPPSAQLKLDLLFDGIRYSDALGKAAEHAFPNFYPYRFQPGEYDPTGKGKAVIPYLFTLEDGTIIRIKGNGASPWALSEDEKAGYYLSHDNGITFPICFEPLPRWMQTRASDGLPMAQAGVSLHGDMAVINVAPGCEYFLHKQEGRIAALRILRLRRPRMSALCTWARWRARRNCRRIPTSACRKC